VANSILPKTSPFLISASSNSHHLLRGDFAELFESGVEVFDDFLGENIGIGEIVGFFQTFVAEPENVEAGFVAVK
jgi:hypothetical protein